MLFIQANLHVYVCIHVVSGHIDVHSSKKRFNSITPNFDKTVNYSLGVFSKKGVEN